MWLRSGAAPLLAHRAALPTMSNDPTDNPSPAAPGSPPAAVPSPAMRVWTFRRVRKTVALCLAASTPFLAYVGKVITDHVAADPSKLVASPLPGTTPGQPTSVTQTGTGPNGQQIAFGGSTIGTVNINAAPIPATAPATPTPTPTPEPPAPGLTDFAGNWEIQALIADDGAGNQIYYQPVRFSVDANGQVTGKASVILESRGGKLKANQPPRVCSLAGAISAPRNKKHVSAGSALGPAGVIYYKAADIAFKLDDGTEGSGIIGLTENLPVAEYVTMSKGAITGRHIAQKH